MAVSGGPPGLFPSQAFRDWPFPPSQQADPQDAAMDQFVSSQKKRMQGIGRDPIDDLIRERLQSLATPDAGMRQATSTFSRYSDPTATGNALFTQGADQATAAAAARWGQQQEGLAQRGLTPQDGAFQAAQNQNMMQRQQDVQRARLGATLGAQQQSMQAAGNLARVSGQQAAQTGAALGQMQAQNNRNTDRRDRTSAALDYATFMRDQQQAKPGTVYQNLGSHGMKAPEERNLFTRAPVVWNRG